jgi:hypothetical protein
VEDHDLHAARPEQHQAVHDVVGFVQQIGDEDDEAAALQAFRQLAQRLGDVAAGSSASRARGRAGPGAGDGPHPRRQAEVDVFVEGREPDRVALPRDEPGDRGGQRGA